MNVSSIAGDRVHLWQERGTSSVCRCMECGMCVGGPRESFLQGIEVARSQCGSLLL